VSTLRLVSTADTEKHNGEVFACAYTPDGGFVLSAGWDGHLRLWEVSTGVQITALHVGAKPLSACTITPDAKRWVAGSMEGLITFWDSHTHELRSQVVAHTRPVSCLRFSPDASLLASTSWDRQLGLRFLDSERDSRTFTAHDDIVTGCAFSPDGRSLLTWSHDQTLKWWDVESNRLKTTLEGHQDRVTAADVSPDGQLAASGSRGGELIVWNRDTNTQAGAMKLGSEVRGCFFLPDASGLLVAESSGQVHLFSMPGLQPQVALVLQQPVQCGALSPDGRQLALGGEDGVVRFVAVEGGEERPLVVTATQSLRVTATRLQKLFGRSTRTLVYSCTCPSCRHPVERLGKLSADPFPCPKCRRPLRFNRQPLIPQENGACLNAPVG